MRAEQQQIDAFPPTGAELRDDGIRRAIEHAESKIPMWKIRALTYLSVWLDRPERPGRFFAEEVRVWAESRGLEAPPDPRAWGGVFQHAARYRMIRRVGYGPQRTPTAHCAPKSIWEKA